MLPIFENTFLGFIDYQVSISEFVDITVRQLYRLVFRKTCTNTEPCVNTEPHHLLINSEILLIFLYQILWLSFSNKLNLIESSDYFAAKVLCWSTNVSAKKLFAKFDTRVEKLKNLPTTSMDLPVFQVCPFFMSSSFLLWLSNPWIFSYYYNWELDINQ